MPPFRGRAHPARLGRELQRRERLRAHESRGALHHGEEQRAQLLSALPVRARQQAIDDASRRIRLTGERRPQRRLAGLDLTMTRLLHEPPVSACLGQ